eukprot:c14194_g1_i1.p1 GENE.c14194_g1_i1~~c14194_g1_i1.p1  ORF type:complete len:264 (-),score=37.93 c14194_g1_i1:603-1394(-)
MAARPAYPGAAGGAYTGSAYNPSYGGGVPGASGIPGVPGLPPGMPPSGGAADRGAGGGMGAPSAGGGFGGGSGPVEEVRLGRSQEEREKIELLSNYYAIINSLEYLERAFMDDVATDKYSAVCSKLLTQYRVAAEALGPEANLDSFMATYGLQCPLAVKRIRSGVDATVEHGGATAEDLGQQSQRILETATSFVTCLDMFAMGAFSVDEMTPRLTEVLTGLNSIASLPPTFEGKVKTKEWCVVHSSARGWAPVCAATGLRCSW